MASDLRRTYRSEGAHGRMTLQSFGPGPWTLLFVLPKLLLGAGEHA